MNHPLVSVVVLCWNRKEDVCESLARLQEQTYGNVEVIVVDNHSTDDTPDAIEREYPNVKVIRMFKNIGIEAYNIGFENAKGDYIVILDDDSFPHRDAISRMVTYFARDERLGAIAFDVRNYYKYDEIQKENDSPLQDNTAAVARDYLMAFNGAGVGIRREVLKRVGYYPEEFFLYWNEQDTAFRILNAGYKIQFFTDVICYHKYSPKNRTSWRAPFYYTRNAFWLIWKNYPSDMVFRLTIQLAYRCFYHSFEQKTWIYVKAMLEAFVQAKRQKLKRSPVRRDIAKNLRIPFHVAFTFYR